jgi:hypothetical protein
MPIVRQTRRIVPKVFDCIHTGEPMMQRTLVVSSAIFKSLNPVTSNPRTTGEGWLRGKTVALPCLGLEATV